MAVTAPWVWRSQPLHHRTGSAVFAALFLQPCGSRAIATLLESPAPNPAPGSSGHGTDVTPRGGGLPHARYSICAGAPRYLNGQPQLWTPTIGKVFPLLKGLLSWPQIAASFTPPLPFTGGWLGWLGYDVAWEVEKLPQINTDPLPFPAAYWYEPSCFAVLDHRDQLLWLAGSTVAELESLEKRLDAPPSWSASAAGLPPFPNSTSQEGAIAPRFQTSQAEYEAAVRQAKAYIQAGDIFQANLSLRFDTATTVDSWLIYQALQHINPSPFASYWQTPWGSVMSCSPERLVQLNGNQAQTRPIAGTRPRGTTTEGDRHLAQELLSSAKENAEHIMLVDLERNDLGRVCEWGSVQVDELLTIERYSHVMHLVSNVRGTLSPNADPVDLIRALFPGGTITGCPKVRCMEIIEELEPVRRSLFYGSCGYLDWRGNLDLNILIRTLLHTPVTSRPSPSYRVWGQVGAGIVADSQPAREWHESLSKATAQLAALTAAHRPSPIPRL